MKYLAKAQKLGGGTHLRHDPEIQCRAWRQADEPGFVGLLQQGQEAAGRHLAAGRLRRETRPPGTPGRALLFSFAFQRANAFIRPASWPGGRTSKSRKAAGEESPGSMETRCRLMAGGGDPRESATESKPPRLVGLRAGDVAARVKGWGKSPPRDWQQERHGKPHREQNRIGTVEGQPSGLFPAHRPGRLHEARWQHRSKTNGRHVPAAARRRGPYRTRLTGRLALFSSSDRAAISGASSDASIAVHSSSVGSQPTDSRTKPARRRRPSGRGARPSVCTPPKEVAGWISAQPSMKASASASRAERQADQEAEAQHLRGGEIVRGIVRRGPGKRTAPTFGWSLQARAR